MEALTRCCRVPFDVLLNEATPISALRQGETAAHLSLQEKKKTNSHRLMPVFSYKKSMRFIRTCAALTVGCLVGHCGFLVVLKGTLVVSG